MGVPVRAGTSVNVVAVPEGADLTQPHLIVGAHLDTVPQAPGAEDNASGVGVLLAAAQAVAGEDTRLPVAFVAFGESLGPVQLAGGALVIGAVLVLSAVGQPREWRVQ